MSTHPLDDLLADAVDGSLSPADRHVVEAHLRTCSRCREEVASAGRARDALGALPDELAPPIDVAAAVAAAGAAAGHITGAPRWYRAAVLVAAAAAIALAVLVIPDLTRGGSQETTGAVGAAPQEAGVSGGDRSAPVPFAGVPGLEVVGTDFDHASLPELVRETRSAAAATSGDATPRPTIAGPSGADALACIRAGADGTIAPDAHVERLLAATFGGTPAFIGVVVSGPADDPAGVLVVAVARDGCRLLDSA